METKEIKPIFAVITEVPKSLTGNRACAELYILPTADPKQVGANLVVDPPESIRGYTDMFVAAASSRKKVKILDLSKKQLVFCSTPVFQLGEILVLDHPYGRSIPDGRKPAKWDIQYECFEDLNQAIARAKAVYDLKSFLPDYKHWGRKRGGHGKFHWYTPGEMKAKCGFYEHATLPPEGPKRIEQCCGHCLAKAFPQK